MNNYRYKLTAPYIIEKIPSLEHIKKNDIVVKPTFLSICAADQRYFFGKRSLEVLKQKLPLCLIHEAIGKVTYSNHSDYKKDDLVILYPNLLKNHPKNENYNPKAKFMSSSTDGFMQELIVIDKSNLIKMNRDLGDNNYLYVMVELLSIIVHTIQSHKVIFNKSKKIALFGDGNLAYLAHLYLSNLYPDKLIYVFGKNNLKLNLFLNSVIIINSLNDDISKYKFDLAIEMVGSINSELVIDNIINNIDPQGYIFLLGVSENKIQINTRLILEKGLTLIGRSRSSKNDFYLSRDFISVHYEQIKKIISEIICVKNVDDMQEAYKKSTINSFKTIMKWEI